MPAKLVQLRRGTTPEHSIFVGKQGEITVDITKNTVIAHDEFTQGGHPLAKEDLSNVIGQVGITQLKFNGTSTAGNFLSIDENGEFLFNPVDIIGTNVGGDLTGTVGNAQIAPNTININELNVSDGTTGQVLSRNGSGGLVFIDVIYDPATGGDLSGLASNAQISPGVVGITELDVDDGQPGQILSTDGNGVLSFIDDTDTTIGDAAVGGDVTGTISNITIPDNSITIAKLGVTDSGNSGDVLSTNGAGGLSFITSPTPVEIIKDFNNPAADTNPDEGIGTIWLNKTSGNIWSCIDNAHNNNVWKSSGIDESIQAYTYQGTQFGYAIGGYLGGVSSASYIDSVQKYAFSSTTTGNNIGSLSVGNLYNGAGYASTIHGYIANASQSGTRTGKIFKVAYTNETQSSFVGNLLDSFSTSENGNSMCSPTHGYHQIGHAAVNSIESFSFSSDGNGSGQLASLSPATNNATGGNSETHGYTAGGSGAAVYVFTYSSNVVSNNVSQLNQAKTNAGGVSSTNHMFVVGGSSGGYTTTIDKIAFASGNIVTSHGNLEVAQNPGAASSETTHGYFAGGNFESGGHTTSRTDIKRISYANSSTSVEVGSLDGATYGPSGTHV